MSDPPPDPPAGSDDAAPNGGNDPPAHGGQATDRHESLWLATSPSTDYAPLDGDLQVDTAVVGGGIAGITTAAKLADAGQDVALFERDRILASVTGHTTAKLTALHGLAYSHIESNVGTETARLYADANQRAIEDVAETVEALDVDCGFTRATAYTYVTDPDQRRRVHREADVATRVGLPATVVESTDLPFAVDSAIAVSDQAHFHPRRYLLALAETIEDSDTDSRVFEETTVTDVRDGDPCAVRTDRGAVRADDVVLATHFPISDTGLYFSRLTPRRSYVLAVRLAGTSPEGMYYRSSDPYFSVRPTTEDDLVLLGGQNHRTGAGDEDARYRELEREARRQFDVEELAYRWSTQDYTSIDGVPFVGPAGPGTDHVYVATGFGGWGMTNGTAAGLLLRDLILDRSNDWAAVYDPKRVRLRASAGSLVSHNVHAMKHLVGDRVGSQADLASETLPPGAGDVFDVDGESVAISRTEDGALQAVSAVCTHMGCLVHWNDGEDSWDCPCHGSRFDADGSVLDTPANESLAPVDVDVSRLVAADPGEDGRSGRDDRDDAVDHRD